MTLLLVGATASPVGATPIGSFTIDSTNCNSSGGCFGLDWTLSVNSGSYGGGLYAYEAILDVTDDPLVAGDPNVTISAVDFKVSSTVDSGTLVQAPTTLADWSTYMNVLNSAGCTGPSAGFVCSQSATDPAIFTAPISPAPAQEWIWYFNTSDPIVIDGAHIGAKMTTLSTPGKLLSATYSVPEPSSLAMLFMGAAAMFGARRRRLV